MTGYPKIPMDFAVYEHGVRAASDRGDCFICSIVSGARDDHLVVFRDDVCIAWVARSASASRRNGCTC